MPEQVEDPLFGDEPVEVPLENAPLVRVLSQVKFTEVLSVTKKEFVAEFQEAIRDSYPFLEKDERKVMAQSPSEVHSEYIWRFYDEKKIWRISLASNFVSLETLEYESREDFCQRFKFVLSALNNTIRPGYVTRVGVRYVDRVVGDQFEEIGTLLRKDMVGIVTSPLNHGLEHTMTETVCRAKEGRVFVRWGVLPPEATHDPDIMRPCESKSWILDLDVSKEYSSQSEEFDAEVLSEKISALAMRAYTIFRWSVTEEFLQAYGGRL